MQELLKSGPCASQRSDLSSAGPEGRLSRAWLEGFLTNTHEDLVELGICFKEMRAHPANCFLSHQEARLLISCPCLPRGGYAGSGRSSRLFEAARLERRRGLREHVSRLRASQSCSEKRHSASEPPRRGSNRALKKLTKPRHSKIRPRHRKMQPRDEKKNKPVMVSGNPFPVSSGPKRPKRVTTEVGQ